MRQRSTAASVQQLCCSYNLKWCFLLRAAPEGDKAVEGQKVQPTGEKASNKEGKQPYGPKRGSQVFPSLWLKHALCKSFVVKSSCSRVFVRQACAIITCTDAYSACLHSAYKLVLLAQAHKPVSSYSSSSRNKQQPHLCCCRCGSCDLSHSGTGTLARLSLLTRSVLCSH